MLKILVKWILVNDYKVPDLLHYSNDFITASPSLTPLSVYVYLSGVRALHVEQGLPDPLQNCLCLQRVVRGIKRSPGSSSSSCLPITDSHMLFIWKSLNMHLPEHCMFWAACTLGYFGFFRAGEFTVPNLASFSSSIHLTMQDIAVNGASSPSCMRVTIKASKADPFHKGANRHIGLGSHPLCGVQVMITVLQDGRPLSGVLLPDWLRQIFSAAANL